MTSLIEQIRPFEEEDREVVVGLRNKNQPPHRHMSVASWLRRDRIVPPTQVEKRYVVGRPAQAFAAVTDLNTTSWKMDDVCEFNIYVAEEIRHQGVGSALYKLVEEFARDRGAKRLLTHTELRPGEEDALTFLTKREFQEQDREQPSFIRLEDLNPHSFDDALEKAHENGVRIFSYADIPDTEENRRKFYELFKPCIYDIPRNDTQPFVLQEFEQFDKEHFGVGEDRNLMVFAEKDGEWVGLTFIMPRPDSKHAMQWLTGVLKDYRGFGIATAMKVHCYVKAKELGYETISTENHVDNGPMLAINKKFGFMPDPPLATFNKVLIDTGAQCQEKTSD